jgi:hypothetical protein
MEGLEDTMLYARKLAIVVTAFVLLSTGAISPHHVSATTLRLDATPTVSVAPSVTATPTTMATPTLRPTETPTIVSANEATASPTATATSLPLSGSPDTNCAANEKDYLAKQQPAKFPGSIMSWINGTVHLTPSKRFTIPLGQDLNAPAGAPTNYKANLGYDPGSKPPISQSDGSITTYYPAAFRGILQATDQHKITYNILALGFENKLDLSTHTCNQYIAYFNVGPVNGPAAPYLNIALRYNPSKALFPTGDIRYDLLSGSKLFSILSTQSEDTAIAVDGIMRDGKLPTVKKGSALAKRIAAVLPLLKQQYVAAENTDKAIYSYSTMLTSVPKNNLLPNINTVPNLKHINIINYPLITTININGPKP